MKLILQYDSSPAKRTMYVYQDDTIGFILRRLKEAGGALEYKGRELDNQTTVRENQLPSAAKLIIFSARSTPPRSVRSKARRTKVKSSRNASDRDERPRAPCRHQNLSPSAVFKHFLWKLRNGATDLYCPVAGCSATWYLDEVMREANLGKTETELFRQYFDRNLKIMSRSRNIHMDIVDNY
ncbi:hypothetical protein ScPMuIL_004434 [Solemya velum]